MYHAINTVDDMTFLLNEVFNLPNSWATSDGFSEYSGELAEAILTEAQRFASEVIAPLNRNGDEQGCRLTEQGVLTPDGFPDAWAQFSASGWTSMAGDPQWGGQGMPKALSVLADEIFYASNSAFMLYATLSVGAALAIDAHACDDLKETYLPPLFEGRWAGVMDLTEPHAGSDLGALRTRASRNNDGSFSIEGSKMFITGGDQDMTENVIHLVLARLEGAPAGHRGISLFLVPKLHVNGDGSLGDANAVTVGSIEHKMGINASATCVVNFDGATGYLVGEENRGLQAMFTMMNYERLSIGVQGLASGQASLSAAVEYASERKQGVVMDNGELLAATIDRHPDVQRMLMTQACLTQAGRALAVYASHCLDCSKQGGESGALFGKRAALLTPVVKAFLTDLGFDVTVIGQQVFGGHGYVREWGQEQWVRDARIAQIYEGTNGIQAQDLVKRKVITDQGETLFALLDEFAGTTSDSRWHDAKQHFVALTTDLLDTCKTDPSKEGWVSVDYLHALGYLLYGYFWSVMPEKAQGTGLHEMKQRLGDFYWRRIFSRFNGLCESVRNELEH